MTESRQRDRANPRDVIEAERSRPVPRVDEQLERELLERVAGLTTAAAPPIASGSLVRGRWGRRAPPEGVREHLSRALRRTAAVALGSLIAYTPLALAGLGAAALLVGGYLLGASDALQNTALLRHTLPGSQTEPSSSSTRATPISTLAPTVAPPSPAVGPSSAIVPPLSQDSPVPPSVVRPHAQRKHPAHPAMSPQPPLAVPEPTESKKASRDRVSAEALESGLLEEARIAVNEGRHGAAMKSLADAARIPCDPLAEEREALTIMVLERAGNVAEARQRIERFGARFPASFYLDRLRTELEPSHDAQ